MSARPTLVRRVVLALLLLAFGLIFALNLAAIFWQVSGQARVDARLRARAETLLALAEGAATTGEARAAAATKGAAGTRNRRLRCASSATWLSARASAWSRWTS